MNKGKILLCLSGVYTKNIIAEYLEEAGYQVIDTDRYPNPYIKNRPDILDIKTVVTEAPVRNRCFVTQENMNHILLLKKDFPNIPLTIIYLNATEQEITDFLTENGVSVDSIVSLSLRDGAYICNRIIENQK